MGVWLPAAARRVTGDLSLVNCFPPYGAKKEEESAQRGSFEFPCFEKATAIHFLLGFHGLAVPPTGVFTRLSTIYLGRVWFHGPGDLGDAVSSPRCPCLQRLGVDGAHGLGGLSIHSESMLQLELKNVRSLSQLTIVAPALKELTLEFCFAKSGPVANITAPLLANLVWNDVYDPSSVSLGKMEHLRLLGTYSCFVYQYSHFMRNQSCVSFLQRFEGIDTLLLTLVYPLDTKYYRYYMMEDIAYTSGHAFGASVLFHVLRLCNGIRRLMLQFVASDSKAQTVCSRDCMCDQPADWETKELLLNHLEEVEIDGLRGSEQEFAFVKRVFNWVTKLKEMTVTFHFSISEIKAKELYKVFQIFSRPEVCMKFYVYRNCSKVLYAPED
ncbi:hypothetical protein SORBI_3002G015700 [Sorghum bicolor]|uniref:FBD domain-containing protein n=2 Tax=Sorghum bicolor TaxID=4558 RepID=A0A1W0W1W3_SORBI|nr:hypothetical protein SORBI_3002G015700 [Sorghum bicolor]